MGTKGNLRRNLPRVMYAATACAIFAAAFLTAYIFASNFAVDQSTNPDFRWSTSPEANTWSQRKLSGGADWGCVEPKALLGVVYFIVLCWCCLGLAIVCDVFFVASLEKLSEVFNLSEDVAGATFMAAGSSAPELFTTVVDTFYFKNNAGIATIVGSAVFNILVIIAFSAAMSSSPLAIDWRPLCRDCFFYTVSVGLLLAFVWPSADEPEPKKGYVTWPEALGFIIWYVLYIMFMVYNEQVLSMLPKYICIGVGLCKHPFPEKLDEIRAERQRGKSPISSQDPVARDDLEHTLENFQANSATIANVNINDESFLGIPGPGNVARSTKSVHLRRRFRAAVIVVMVARREFHRRLAVTQNITQALKHKEDREKQAKMTNTHKPGLQRFRAAVNAVIVAEHMRKLAQSHPVEPSPSSDAHPASELTASSAVTEKKNDLVEIKLDMTDALAVEKVDSEKAKDIEDMWYETLYSRAMSLFSMPWDFAFRFSIPDCAEPAYEKYYVVTFINSIIWIGLISWLLVFCISNLGCILGVSPVLLSITVLAMGTSVPDAISSVVVAKNGFGDMAVANAIGSNVFDICLGLGIPYFIATAFMPSEFPNIPIDASDLLSPILVLVATLIIVLLTLISAHWYLTPSVGWILLGAYGLFVIWNLVVRTTVKDA